MHINNQKTSAIIANIPDIIPNIIDGNDCLAISGNTIDKFSPHDGNLLYKITSSNHDDVGRAITVAKNAQTGWADTPPVQRGFILHQICNHLEKNADKIAEIVAKETGKSLKDAKGETSGAIALGRFYAGEGQRLYGRTTTSGTANKYAMTIRQPCGIAGLIVAANTPIANVAWKTFPALICGNAAILKAPEDTPATAWIFTKLLHEAGLSSGLLNLIQGSGLEAGAPIVESADIDVISFTGSTKVGKWIAEIAGKRLAKISLELGGKNPLIVCEDADITRAVNWICLSAFSNAGQRCAAGSRIIIVETVYQKLVEALLAKVATLKVGNSDDDDFGPVVNERQLNNILEAIQRAKSRGANILCGGNRLRGKKHEGGYYIAPTIMDNVSPDDEISTLELFGPVTTLYKARNYAEALALANHSPYGLTACIHTSNFDRATHFTQAIKSGVAVVNGGTFGSEPHMPFGGLGFSGNGSREPGTEALNIYSELKTIYLNVDPTKY